MNRPQQIDVMPLLANHAGGDEDYSGVVEWVVANRNAFSAVADTTLYSVTENGSVVRNIHNIQRHSVWHRHGIRVSPCVYGEQALGSTCLP